MNPSIIQIILAIAYILTTIVGAVVINSLKNSIDTQEKTIAALKTQTEMFGPDYFTKNFEAIKELERTKILNLANQKIKEAVIKHTDESRDQLEKMTSDLSEKHNELSSHIIFLLHL